MKGMNMQRLLNIDDEQRASATTSFNVNRFEVHLPSGALMFAVYTAEELERECGRNRIPLNMDAMAERQYMKQKG